MVNGGMFVAESGLGRIKLLRLSPLLRDRRDTSQP